MYVVDRGCFPQQRNEIFEQLSRLFRDAFVLDLSERFFQNLREMIVAVENVFRSRFVGGEQHDVVGDVAYQGREMKRGLRLQQHVRRRGNDYVRTLALEEAQESDGGLHAQRIRTQKHRHYRRYLLLDGAQQSDARGLRTVRSQHEIDLLQNQFQQLPTNVLHILRRVHAVIADVTRVETGVQEYVDDLRRALFASQDQMHRQVHQRCRVTAEVLAPVRREQRQTRYNVRPHCDKFNVINCKVNYRIAYVGF